MLVQRLQIGLRILSRKASCVRFAHHVNTGEAVVRARDTGTIPFKYRTRCSNGAHRYDNTLAKADTSPEAEDGCLMYFVNSWVLGLPCNSWLSMKRSVCPVTACVIAYYDKLCWWCIHYFTLLHIVTFDIFLLVTTCYYNGHYYILITYF